MKLSALMTHRPVTVEMDDPLGTVLEIFENVRFHHLLVVSHGHLRGIISDRDLLKAISPRIGTPAETNRDRATLNRRAHQIMARNPVVVGADADLGEAVRVFNESGVSCLPVVDIQDKPIGIVSWRDVLRAIAVPGPPKARSPGPG